MSARPRCPPAGGRLSGRAVLLAVTRPYPGLEPWAARCRDFLADKKVLLVLDDAAGHEQVEPLLPGTSGSTVLVTSRRRLAALGDAVVISLDILARDEAAGMLVRLAGRPGLQPADPGVGELARLCGYLPLAIGMLASQLRHHPAWTPADLAADLAAERDRLGLMHAENLSVGAAFSLSYRDLTAGQRRLFRRLGLHQALISLSQADIMTGDYARANAALNRRGRAPLTGSPAATKRQRPANRPPSSNSMPSTWRPNKQGR